MSDLISRQAAIDLYEQFQPYIVVKAVDFGKALEQLPSAQPEIIRCKECKHWEEGTVYSYCDKLYGMGVLDIYDHMTTEDDYCSMAERRTDENENI